MVRLDILSDPICPWCLIGKALLDAALTQRPGHPLVPAWHPFQLNPDMPAGGMDRRDYLEAKFGGREAAARVYARIDEAARAAGIEVDFAAIGRTPNTVDAHRLIHWAGIDHRQGQVVDGLFAAYFLEGRDIGDREVLAQVAGAAGMDGEAVARLLATEADADDVRARDAHARERGVSAVPTFLVGDRHAVPGAQPTELWLQVIDELAGVPAPTHEGGAA